MSKCHKKWNKDRKYNNKDKQKKQEVKRAQGLWRQMAPKRNDSKKTIKRRIKKKHKSTIKIQYRPKKELKWFILFKGVVWGWSCLVGTHQQTGKVPVSEWESCPTTKNQTESGGCLVSKSLTLLPTRLASRMKCSPHSQKKKKNMHQVKVLPPIWTQIGHLTPSQDGQSLATILH